MVRIEAETKMLSHALKHGVVVGPEAPHSTEGEVDDAAEEAERAQEVGDHGCHEAQPCMKQSVPFQQVPVQRVPIVSMGVLRAPLCISVTDLNQVQQISPALLAISLFQNG